MTNAFSRLRKPALICAAAILALLAFAWLALPGIVQSQAERFIAERTGHRLSLARPEINPLALSLRLRDLRLAEPGGEPLAGFGELFVDLSLASLFERAWVFDAIRLEGFSARLVQRREGGLNWTPLLDALRDKSAAEDAKGLPRIDIRQLRLGGAQLEFTDQRVSPAFATRIDPLDLELSEVSTLPDDEGKFRLAAQTQFGAKLEWQGTISLNPLAGSGRVELREIDLARLAQLLGDRLPLPPPAGTAALAADYRLARSTSGLDLVLEPVAFTLAALRQPLGAGAAAPLLAVDRIEFGDGRFDLGASQATVGTMRLRGSRIEAATGGKPPGPLGLDEITLADLRIELAGRKAALASLAIKGGKLGVRRDAAGRIDLLAAIDGLGGTVPKAASAPPPDAVAAAPWRFGVGRVALSSFGIAVRDEAVSPAAELALEDVAATVEGISDNLKAPLSLKAGFAVKSGGRLDLAGRLVPADATAELNLKLAGLALNPAQPYLAKFAALDLAGGQLSAAGRITHGAQGSHYRGSIAVDDLRLDEAGTQTRFLAWKSLSSKDLSLAPQRLDMPQLALDGLDAKLVIAKDKSTNLKRVLRGEETAVPPAPTSAAAAPAAVPDQVAAPADAAPSAGAAAAAPAFELNIDRLRLRNGTLDFADHSLVLPFGTRIHGLRGSITGLSSKPGAPGQVELDGEVDDYGLARAVGQLDFFNPTDFMDLKVVFRNVEMTRMTPYSATFAGRRIDSGKLSLDLDYRIKQRQLQGENQVVIDRLVLGERVESPTAKDLPLDLAIAILSDSDGRIDLGLPISGSLDDPQFSYGQIVWKAIVNVLGKIVTAPFRALGTLFGGGGEKLDNIAFEAGSGSLTPPEREKLVRLAAVLNKRPGLALGVRGTWAEADRLALQDLQLRRVVAERSGQAAGEKGDPGPLSTRSPRIQAALETLFGDRFGGAELAALKEGFRSANPGQMEENLTGRMMSRLSGLLREKKTLGEAEVARLKGADFHLVLFERLRVAEPVGDDAMQALAARRTQYAVSNLKAAGAPEARIRAGAPEKAEAAGREVLLRLEVGRAGG